MNNIYNLLIAKIEEIEYVVEVTMVLDNSIKP